MLNAELLTIIKVFRKWRHYLTYVLYSIEIFIDHLNHRYLITKAKLNGKKTRWIEKLAAFNFTIIYRERAKNLVDNLSRRSDFKDDNELFTTRH